VVSLSFLDGIKAEELLWWLILSLLNSSLD
jgi:hypothetical protein